MSLTTIGTTLRPTLLHFRPIIATRGVEILKPYKRYLSTKKSDKNVLLIGCSGALGTAIANQAPKVYKILGADILGPEYKLEHFLHIPLSCHHSVEELFEHLRHGVLDHLDKGNHLAGVICTSGGWLSDPVRELIDTPMNAHEYAEGVDKMLKANIYPIVTGSLISMEFLAKNGLFLTVGAEAALNPTPNMAAYGLSKAANHHLIQTLGEAHKAPRPRSHLSEAFEDVTALSLLPTVLDTEVNRKAMPDADTEHWIKTEDIARQIWEWVQQPDSRPQSGSLVKASKEKGQPVFRLAR